MEASTTCSSLLAAAVLGFQSNNSTRCPGVSALANGTFHSRLMASNDCINPACASVFLALESLPASVNCSVWDEDTARSWPLHHVNQSLCLDPKAVSFQSSISSAIGVAKSFPVGVIVVIVLVLVAGGLIYMWHKNSSKKPETASQPGVGLPTTHNAHHAPVYCDPPPHHYCAPPPPQWATTEAASGPFGLSQEQMDQLQEVATGIYHAYVNDNGEFFGDGQGDGGAYYESDGGGFV
ncbi:Aste57867_12328 [Aphanomyces stellatus]|uniref:Aste57867_12328 protein n=1 Tax=Aphanomyces stellatus TaxID=120398 RepID=A0A485KVB1_9STRA|nr:hypothetical protein As57867_012282 [Aphanomyces stellatus]VFT89180.1 Aste57867_12328 [Aphanomyces stellatus]